MHRDFEPLRSAALRAGWTVERTRNSHWKFLSPDKTVPVIIVSGTPSDWRAIHKVRLQLKRAGLDV